MKKRKTQDLIIDIESANEVKKFLGELPYTLRVMENDEEVAKASTFREMLDACKDYFSSSEFVDIMVGEIVPTSVRREFKIDGVKGIRLIVE